MAKIITTGPAHMFVGQTADTNVDSLNYLGTFEKSPVIDIQTLTQGVKNDIGGESDIAVSMQGQIATIQGVMNRFDDDEFAKLEAGYYDTSSKRGEIVKSKMGALAQAMTIDFDVVFYFPFHSSFRTADGKALDAPEGLHFVSVVPAKIKLAELSTRARSIEIALRAIPKMSIKTTPFTNDDSNGTAGPASVREFVLYNHIAAVSATLKGKVN